MKLAPSLLGAAIAACSPLAGAATFTVTNLNDNGAGSLRDAIGQANAAAGGMSSSSKPASPGRSH